MYQQLQKEMDKKQVFSDLIFPPFCNGDKQLSAELTALLYQRFIVENSSYQSTSVWHIVESYFIGKVIPHKIEVRKAGLELLEHNWFVKLLSLSDYSVSENPVETFKYNLFIHDLSKFSLNEAYGYAIHDFKNPEPTLSIFKNAWHHHKINNPHHPEYWFDVGRDGKTTPLPMPGIYVAEMVADWMGASRSYGQNLEEWLSKNVSQYLFHPYTATLLHNCLSEMGFKVQNNGQQLSIN
ncbi:DUF5662 family protein [Runella sp.]|uniref:DUF5662 family protein n=1 Tax=Runella sp. TaxID=1960881 RepID=UPI003D0B4396